MLVRIVVSIVLGGVLGIVGSRFLFVGSWISLIPWAIFGLCVGAISKSKESILNGGLFGFVLSATFMIAGYAGTAPIFYRLPFFVIIGLIGAGCGIVLALLGNQTWKRIGKNSS